MADRWPTLLYLYLILTTLLYITMINVTPMYHPHVSNAAAMPSTALLPLALTYRKSVTIRFTDQRNFEKTPSPNAPLSLSNFLLKKKVFHARGICASPPFPSCCPRISHAQQAPATVHVCLLSSFIYPLHSMVSQRVYTVGQLSNRNKIDKFTTTRDG